MVYTKIVAMSKKIYVVHISFILF